MWYTYVLISLKNKKLYIGYTSDLRRRVQEHNSGRGGDYSSSSKPFKLIFYEAFTLREEAVNQEKFYKTGYGREVLCGKLRVTLSKYGR